MSLLGALLAAVCFGAASVLEALAARATVDSAGIDPGLLVRLLRNWRFIVGIGLDILGFLFEFAALRMLPLFLVQAAVASSLAVTAVLAARVMREKLGRLDWAAVVGVCVGLGMLGLSSGHEGTSDPGGWFDVGMAVAVVVLGLAAVAIARAAEPVRSIGLGLCAGLLFGVVALAARTLVQLDPVWLIREPSVYLLIVSGLFGYLLYATALQRGSVTSATAAMVVGETAAPAGIGLLVLGDSARHGFVPVAIVGFLLAVTSAVSLARFGELPPPHDNS